MEVMSCLPVSGTSDMPECTSYIRSAKATGMSEQQAREVSENMDEWARAMVLTALPGWRHFSSEKRRDHIIVRREPRAGLPSVGPA